MQVDPYDPCDPCERYNFERPISLFSLPAVVPWSLACLWLPMPSTNSNEFDQSPEKLQNFLLSTSANAPGQREAKQGLHGGIATCLPSTHKSNQGFMVY
jgi:hypothetical protein